MSEEDELQLMSMNTGTPTFPSRCKIGALIRIGAPIGIGMLKGWGN